MKVAIFLLAFIALISTSHAETYPSPPGNRRTCKDGDKTCTLTVGQVVDQLSRLLDKATDFTAQFVQKAKEVIRSRLVADVSRYMNTIDRLTKFGIQVLEKFKRESRKNSEFNCTENKCVLCFNVPKKYIDLEKPVNKACLHWNISVEYNSVEMTACLDENCYTASHFFSIYNYECVNWPTAPSFSACVRLYELDTDPNEFKVCFFGEINFITWRLVSINLHCYKVDVCNRAYVVKGVIPVRQQGYAQVDGFTVIPQFRDQDEIQII